VCRWHNVTFKKNICDKHLKIINDERNLKVAQNIYIININFLKALDKLNSCPKKELLSALPLLHYVYDFIGTQRTLNSNLIEDIFTNHFFNKLPTSAVTEKGENALQKITNYLDIFEPSLYYWASDEMTCIHKFMKKFFPKNILLDIDYNNARRAHTFKSPCLLLIFVTIDDRWNDIDFWVDFTFTKSAETNENSAIVRVHSNRESIHQKNPDNIISKVGGEQVFITTEVKMLLDTTGMVGEIQLINEDKLKNDILSLLHKCQSMK